MFITEGRLFAVVWEEITEAEVREALDRLRVHHKKTQEQILYVGVITPSTRLPDAEARKALSETSGTVLDELCDKSILIHAGTGFVSAALRGALATLIMMSKNRKRAIITSSFAEAIQKVASAEERRLLTKLQSKIEEAGIELKAS